MLPKISCSRNHQTDSQNDNKNKYLYIRAFHDYSKNCMFLFLLVYSVSSVNFTSSSDGPLAKRNYIS